LTKPLELPVRLEPPEERHLVSPKSHQAQAYRRNVSCWIQVEWSLDRKQRNQDGADEQGKEMIMLLKGSTAKVKRRLCS
jgi:hypothetical protein